MSKVFKVSRSGYYQWLKKTPSKRFLERQQLIDEVKSIHQQSKGRYGSPKITEELRDRGWKISRPRIAKMMKQEGLRSIVHRKFRVVTTDSRHNLPVAENILNRDFTAHSPVQKWVSDITYIPTVNGWLYLTIIMDLYDRKIIGWSISTSMTTRSTVLAAWKMALINRPIQPEKLIFHSDRGVQYASALFKGYLEKKKVIQSMSRKGNCWDNAVAENFFRIIKSELVKHTTFRSMIHVRIALFEYIEIWYNRKRKHAYLGYLTPEQFNNHHYFKCA